LRYAVDAKFDTNSSPTIPFSRLSTASIGVVEFRVVDSIKTLFIDTLTEISRDFFFCSFSSLTKIFFYENFFCASAFFYYCDFRESVYIFFFESSSYHYLFEG
jgi:hypothetical protein